MPANRSRTLEWRRCLEQVQQRGGALEIAVARNYEEDDGRHLIWRVRLLDLKDGEILIEQPITLGQVIRLESGIQLVAILAIGQNRWLFKTTNLGPRSISGPGGRTTKALRLRMPDTVDRCQRRNFLRMETGRLNLPEVEMWPLLDPKSVLVAERAIELHFQNSLDRQSPTFEDTDFDQDFIMPEVGPKFTAILLNIGGGGIGLRVRPQDAGAFARQKLFWLRFSLPPELSTPICATGKLAHTNVDSMQHTYAGLAFDFSFNPIHQRFVIEQITRYLTLQQQGQLEQQAAEARRRRSA